MKRLAFLPSHKRNSRRSVGAVLGLLVVGLVAIVSACSDQGEGERCEIANGNDDCQSGLACFPSEQLKGAGSALCCPFDRSTATNPLCRIATSFAADASAPPDTGPAPVADASSTTDADATTTTDAEADAADADAADQ